MNLGATVTVKEAVDSNSQFLMVEKPVPCYDTG